MPEQTTRRYRGKKNEVTLAENQFVDSLVMPKDTLAEKAVLSALFIDSSLVARAASSLKESHFELESHKIIFRTVRELYERNTEVDIITILSRLEQKDLLEKAGGRMYISEISDVVLSGDNFEYHMEILFQKAILRDMINAGRKIISLCFSSQNEVDNIIDEAEQIVFTVAERPDQRGFVKISDVLPNTMTDIERIATTKSGIQGLPTGYHRLDKLTGGFKPGQLIVLAARPAMGKTSFALNIALNAVQEHEAKVGIFTLEMGTEELLLRLLSSASKVPLENILKGYGMSQEKLANLTQISMILSEKDLFIDDNGGNSVLDIKAKSRRLKAELGDLDLIIIDYLQLMSGHAGGRQENRQQEIAEISRFLKIMARELEVPVIALSQLNRALENRDNKRPQLSDLRESGAIEQDADLVLFIYRDEVYTRDDPKKQEDYQRNKGTAEIIVGKNRQGPTGNVKLLFKAEITGFENLDEHYDGMDN